MRRNKTGREGVLLLFFPHNVHRNVSNRMNRYYVIHPLLEPLKHLTSKVKPLCCLFILSVAGTQNIQSEWIQSKNPSGMKINQITHMNIVKNSAAEETNISLRVFFFKRKSRVKPGLIISLTEIQFEIKANVANVALCQGRYVVL